MFYTFITRVLYSYIPYCAIFPNLITACAIVSEIFYRMGLGILEKASNEVRTLKV